MKLTNKMDIENIKGTMDIYISGKEKEYKNHPSYLKFVNAIKGKCE